MGVDRQLALADHVADVVRVGLREARVAHLLVGLPREFSSVDAAVGGAVREDFEVDARHLVGAAALREVALHVVPAMPEDRRLVHERLARFGRLRLAERDAVGDFAEDERL